MDEKESKLFWLDMEMTGLDEKTCHILEAAAVVTDLELKKIDEYQEVVYQPQEILESMDEWCQKTHGESGLTAEVSKGKPLSDVEQHLILLAKKHFGEGEVVLCGNSIGQDRKFIDVFMPKFEKYLHYRMIDVSSFKEIFQRKYGIEFPKKETHRAREDIYESIAELAHYLTYIKIK